MQHCVRLQRKLDTFVLLLSDNFSLIMNTQTTEQMPVVDNYLNILDEVTLNKIEELKADNYHDEDMIDFIKEYGSNNFLAYYEEYVRKGEELDYDVVDAFVEEFGIQCIEHFDDAYIGQYDSEEQFAEQYIGEMYISNLDDLPVVIDWTATWNCNLKYDFSFNDGYVFRSNFWPLNDMMCQLRNWHTTPCGIHKSVLSYMYEKSRNHSSLPLCQQLEGR